MLDLDALDAVDAGLQAEVVATLPARQALGSQVVAAPPADQLPTSHGVQPWLAEVAPLAVATETWRNCGCCARSPTSFRRPKAMPASRNKALSDSTS